MKIDICVSDPMMSMNSSQAETIANGALAMALQKALPFSQAAQSDGTRRVYADAFAQWAAWCDLHHTSAMPAAPEAVAAYLASLARAGKSVSAINVALSAIQFHHRAVGHVLDRKHPMIAGIVAGIARTCERPRDRAAALDLASLRRLVASLSGEDLRSLRDRALILIAFFAALRRSEIASLDLTGRSPIALSARGLVLHLTSTKASRTTETVALPRRSDELCPVAALETYLAKAALTSGPLFRAVSKAGRLLERRLDPTSVRHILAQRLAMAGLETTRYSPHSLRAGFITAAAAANVPEHLIQRTSRHKSVDVLRSYIRAADAFDDNAARFV